LIKQKTVILGMLDNPLGKKKEKAPILFSPGIVPLK